MSQSTKEEAPSVQAGGFYKYTFNSYDFSAKSTRLAAQYRRILSELLSGPKNTIQLRRAGIMQPAARIKELRENHGIDVNRIELVSVFDAEGFEHRRVAVYALGDCANGGRP
jgi:Helix-turn-helix domain